MGEGLILETERLVLREFKFEDTDDLLGVLGDPITMQYYPAPFSRDEVDGWIRTNRARYSDVGFGLWAIQHKHSGEFVGDCGCFLRELQGSVECEVAWHVRRDLWGRGYASEAARHCIEFAFLKLGMERVIALVRPENRSSCRVAEKNGMTCSQEIFWRDYDHRLYMKQK